MAAVQVSAVAGRAGIAAGTVYRYFPTKNDLVAELIAAVAGRELEAMQTAADAAPGREATRMIVAATIGRNMFGLLSGFGR